MEFSPNTLRFPNYQADKEFYQKPLANGSYLSQQGQIQETCIPR